MLSTFPWTAKYRSQSDSRDRSKRQTLRFESLESRRLLAVAAFQTELLRDDNGNPGELIADNTLVAGETFYLRITAEEFDPLHSGLRAAAVNVDWDSSLMGVVDEDFDVSEVLTENFPVYQYAELDRDAGSLRDLSGLAVLTWQAGRAIGDGTPETFAIIKMKAGEQSGETSIELSKSRVKSIMVPTAVLGDQHIDFDREAITIVPAAQPLAPESATSTDAIPDAPATTIPVVSVVEFEKPTEQNPVVEADTTTNQEVEAEPPHRMTESTVAVDQIMSFDMNQDGVFDLGDFGLLNIGATTVPSIELPEAEPDAVVAESPELDPSPVPVTVPSTTPATLHTCLAFPEGSDDAATEAWLDAFATAWIADTEARQRRREQAELF